MKKFLILVGVAVFTVSMVAGCVTEAQKTKTYTGPEQFINIGVNDEFVIALDFKGGGSGLEWREDYDATMLALVDSRIDIRQDMGGVLDGTKLFTFRALRPGQTEITMVYGQWILEQLDKKVFTVNIE